MEVPVIESSSRRGFNWEGTSWKVGVRGGQRAKTHELSLKLFNSPLCLGQSKWRRCHCICTRPPGTSLLPWLAPSWPPRPRSSAPTTSSHYPSSRQTNWPEVRGGGICQRSRGRLGLPGFDRRTVNWFANDPTHTDRLLNWAKTLSLFRLCPSHSAQQVLTLLYSLTSTF